MIRRRTILSMVVLLTCATGLALAAGAGKPAANAKEPQDPRFRGISKEDVEILKEFEKKNRRFFSEWMKLREMQDELKRLTSAYGSDIRREADRKVPSLISKAKTQEAKLEKMYHRLREPIDEKEAKAKDMAFKLSQKGATGNARTDKKRDETLTQLYAEAQELGDQGSALAEMFEMVSGELGSLKGKEELAGFSGHDSEVREILDEFPKIVDARLAIKDIQADIKMLTTKEKEGKLNISEKRTLARADPDLQKAVAQLEKEIARATKPFDREMASLDKKIASTEKRIAEYKKRKRDPMRYEEKLFDLKGEADKLNRQLEIYKEMGKWQEPEKKPKKAPAKKGGH